MIDYGRMDILALMNRGGIYYPRLEHTSSNEQYGNNNYIIFFKKVFALVYCPFSLIATFRIIIVI